MALTKIVVCPKCGHEYNHMEFESEDMFDRTKVQACMFPTLTEVMSKCLQCKHDFVIDVSDQYFN
jgi:hypothetical protein